MRAIDKLVPSCRTCCYWQRDGRCLDQGICAKRSVVQRCESVAYPPILRDRLFLQLKKANDVCHLWRWESGDEASDLGSDFQRKSRQSS